MATKLEISQLDFDGIKDNLKTFLSQQDEFVDYDFQGSGMNILLDVLAYNTHYLGYNACLLYTSPSPRDLRLSRMPSSA